MADSEIRSEDEFFIGYLPKMPRKTASFIRRTVVGLALLVVALALILTSQQNPFPVGSFEFGIVRDFSGTVHSQPYPTLAVQPPGESVGAEPFYLVAPGKYGAESEVSGLEGQAVELQGSLLYREGQTMIEVVPGSVQPAVGTDPVAKPGPESLGEQTLVGEIVDSKCYLGLMKPSDGKPHRGCASLCIRGGIPPIFVVRGKDGPAAHLLLVDASGAAVNQRVLDVVAEPLEITGEVVRLGDLWLLKADPETYRRLATSS